MSKCRIGDTAFVRDGSRLVARLAQVVLPQADLEHEVRRRCTFYHDPSGMRMQQQRTNAGNTFVLVTAARSRGGLLIGQRLGHQLRKDRLRVHAELMREEPPMSLPHRGSTSSSSSASRAGATRVVVVVVAVAGRVCHRSSRSGRTRRRTRRRCPAHCHVVIAAAARATLL